jgi:hypothetical protein
MIRPGPEQDLQKTLLLQELTVCSSGSLLEKEPMCGCRTLASERFLTPPHIHTSSLILLLKAIQRQLLVSR